jgi:hypothetical protein
VSGLERNPQLKELYLSHQELQQDEELAFEDATLKSLRVRCLRTASKLGVLAL